MLKLLAMLQADQLAAGARSRRFPRHLALRIALLALSAAPMLIADVIRAQAVETRPGDRPNIVLIMSDDMNDGCCCGEEIAGENHCFSPSSEMN